MRIIEDLRQGSKEWHQFRMNHVGASDAAVILGLSPWRSAIQLWEEKCLGWEQPSNSAMKRGQQLESLALKQFEEEIGMIFNPMVAECEIYPFLSASFDGMAVDLKLAVEIKCGHSSFKLAQRGEIPVYYIAQLQHQMYIADLPSIYYYCFDGKKGLLMEVERDEDFIWKMLDKELKFWNCVQSFEPPED